jgi:hypothetical protein
MAVKSIDKRRKIRQLEALRDKLMEDSKKLKARMVTLRADLKHQRKSG